MTDIDENERINDIDSRLCKAFEDFGKSVFGFANAIAVFASKSKIMLFNKRVYHLAYQHKNPLVRKKNLKRLWGDDWVNHKTINAPVLAGVDLANDYDKTAYHYPDGRMEVK